jgi:hypothetical protein
MLWRCHKREAKGHEEVEEIAQIFPDVCLIGVWHLARRVCVCVQSVFSVCSECVESVCVRLDYQLLVPNTDVAQCVDDLTWTITDVDHYDASGRGMELLEPIDRHSQCNCPCAFLSVKLLSVSARAHVMWQQREKER